MHFGSSNFNRCAPVTKSSRILPHITSRHCKSRGTKSLVGTTDLEMEISNQCGRLIALVVIYYKYVHSSCYLNKHPSKKILKFLKKSSPVAFQHIHFTGHFTFYDSKNKIDIDKIIEDLEL